MAPTLKKLWEPSPEVSALMQESVRAAQAAAVKCETSIERVIALKRVRDILDEEIDKVFKEAIRR